MNTPAKRMLTKEEAANYCGFKSASGFGAWSPVRPVKIGNKVLYDQKRLDEWLDTVGQNETPKRNIAEGAFNVGPSERH